MCHSPLFLYWQQCLVRSTYLERYHRSPQTKMWLQLATLNLRDWHALHHETCIFYRNFSFSLFSVCFFLLIFFFKLFFLSLNIKKIFLSLYLWQKFINKKKEERKKTVTVKSLFLKNSKNKKVRRRPRKIYVVHDIVNEWNDFCFIWQKITSTVCH